MTHRVKYDITFVCFVFDAIDVPGFVVSSLKQSLHLETRLGGSSLYPSLSSETPLEHDGRLQTGFLHLTH